VAILKEVEAGLKAAEVCCKHGRIADSRAQSQGNTLCFDDVNNKVAFVNKLGSVLLTSQKLVPSKFGTRP
jgi:hypothetical protein